MPYRRPDEAPPLLITAAIITWFVMAALCVVVALLLALTVGLDKPGPLLVSGIGAVVFVIEARLVWVGLRSDVAVSAALSMSFAVLWFAVGSGQSRGFAFVPPGLTIAAAAAVLVSRGAYVRWRTGAFDGASSSEETQLNLDA